MCNSHKKRSLSLLFTILFVFSFAFSALPQAEIIEAAGTAYYVSPSGNDSSSGMSALQPFKTIQKAVDLAVAGQTVYLAAGTYLQDVITKNNGSSSAPITITGPKTATIKGAGSPRVFEINHDYIVLDGFTIDGLHGSSSSMSGYRDKLLYITGKEAKNGVTGVKIINMDFKNGGGECIRMKYFAEKNEIANNTITSCGVHDFKFKAGGKNGEGIYIGTAPEQLAKNPTSDLDKSNNNYIHNNIITTNGNEGVDIKEGSTGNIVEYNIVSGQKDADSAGLGSRGDSNIFRYNEISSCTGAGVRLGGDTYNGVTFGKNNSVYGNKIKTSNYGPIKVQVTPQKDICGNILLDGNGSATGTYGNLSGLQANCSISNPVLSAGLLTSTSSPVQSSPESPDVIEEQPKTPETNPVVEDQQIFSTSQITLLRPDSVKASSHDGNVPENTLDEKLSTRWSAEGSGEYIKYRLAGIKTVSYVDIAFFKGDKRTQKFDIRLSEDGITWKKVYSGLSSGKTNNLQRFNFQATKARYIRVAGFGNSENLWNSLTEVKIYGI